MINYALGYLRLGLKKIFKNEEGQGLVEYGLIIAVVAILLVGTLLLLKDQLITTFNNIITGLKGTNPVGS